MTHASMLHYYPTQGSGHSEYIERRAEGKIALLSQKSSTCSTTRYIASQYMTLTPS
jgi:hypothetical protein